MNKHIYVIFHKPYGVLCQFTGEENDRTLSEFSLPKNIYSVGRLDKDSEGLLLLTNDGVLNARLSDPKNNKEKTYYLQVEKIPTQQDLDKMRKGLKIKNYTTKPCEVELIDDPDFGPRTPPIRERKNIPTAWLKVKISEGKNRQLRRMSAKIGFPTLRLIRVGIGPLSLGDLPPGQWQEITKPRT